MSRSIHDDDFHEDEHEDIAAGLSKATIASIVAVMLVLAAIAGAVLYFGTEGNTLSVTLSEPSRNQDVLTFVFAITTDHGLAGGVGEFRAIAGDTVVYTRSVPADAGGGRIDLRFALFVVGNGEYTFEYTYKGITGTSKYELGIPDRTDYIVTAMHVRTQRVYPDEGKTGAIGVLIEFFSNYSGQYYAAPPPGANISYRVLKNGISQDAPAVTRSVEGIRTLHFNYTPTLLLGNYTVEVTYHNAWVRSDSPIATIADTNVTYVHNRPTACTDKTSYQAPRSNPTITFDGSCSRDDGAIVQYSWDFTDPPGSPPVTNGTSPLETHTFPASVATYNCLMTVQDNGPDGGEFGNATFVVQITFV